jgi:hypothetical protein
MDSLGTNTTLFSQIRDDKTFKNIETRTQKVKMRCFYFAQNSIHSCNEMHNSCVPDLNSDYQN